MTRTALVTLLAAAALAATATAQAPNLPPTGAAPNAPGGYPGGYGGGYPGGGFNNGLGGFNQVVPPSGIQPNVYNRQYQPLSPYLNLLRGGDPGVNYYYGVRPGLPNYGQGGGLGNQNFGNRGAFSQLRNGFFPQAAQSSTGVEDPDRERPDFQTNGLRTNGIPAQYNTFSGPNGSLGYGAGFARGNSLIPTPRRTAQQQGGSTTAPTPRTR